jgi:hypothetical protein
VTKDTLPALQEKVKADMPESFKKLVGDKNVGTRAEVLDIRELRMSRWSGELKAGFVNLNLDTFKMMADIEECTGKCTKGFHYAFDSGDTDGHVYYVCTDPKCVSRKKAAFTRAKNAAGMARKNAERKAIKQAVELTRDIDQMRMLVILMAQVRGRHVGGGYGDDNWRKWMLDHLQIEGPVQDYGDRTHHFDFKVMEAAKLLTAEDLAKLLISFALYCLTYVGEVGDYKIETTEALNLLGIAPVVEDPTKDTPQEEKAAG